MVKITRKDNSEVIQTGDFVKAIQKFAQLSDGTCAEVKRYACVLVRSAGLLQGRIIELQPYLNIISILQDETIVPLAEKMNGYVNLLSQFSDEELVSHQAEIIVEARKFKDYFDKMIARTMELQGKLNPLIDSLRSVRVTLTVFEAHIRFMKEIQVDPDNADQKQSIIKAAEENAGLAVTLLNQSENFYNVTVDMAKQLSSQGRNVLEGIQAMLDIDRSMKGAEQVSVVSSTVPTLFSPSASLPVEKEQADRPKKHCSMM